MLKGIKLVGLPTNHQDRALAFWTNLMGFTVHTDQPFDEKQRWIELRLKGCDTHLAIFTPEGHQNRIGGFANISFYCDDVMKTYEELSARGVVFPAPPKKAEWGTSVIFNDPDGTGFVLSSR